MRVAYCGNFSVSFSTESHVAASLEHLGHMVLRIQEGTVRATDIARMVKAFSADMYLHTQTRGLADSGGTPDERRSMLEDIKSIGIPTVGYHLDLFFGLDRAEYVRTDPYFQTDFFFSTDGGHDAEWADAGVNHYWLPPGVYHAEAIDGTSRDEYRCDVAFVGSWKAYAHVEHWTVRRMMLKQLQRRYGRHFRTFPQGPAVRGMDLTDLYASVKVVVGDSCLAGLVPGYWSDRCPETMGRGAMLVHPFVEGILDVHPHVCTYPRTDWQAMFKLIDEHLADDTMREARRHVSAQHTRDYHTYASRMQTVINTVFA